MRVEIIFVYIALLCLPLNVVLAADYYVDKNHGSASDSNDGTSESLPWLTINKAATTLTAGDTVYVKDGEYNEAVVISNSGSVGSPITFKNYPGHSPVIDGTDVVISSNYALIYANSKDYIIIDGFEFRDSDENCLNMWRCDEFIIRNNLIHSNDVNGRDCVLAGYSEGGLIENNEVYDCGGNAINISSTTDVVVKSNYIHDNPNHTGVNIFPVTTDSQVDFSGNNVFYNKITGCTSGIYSRHQTNNIIAFNLIYDNDVSNASGIYFHHTDGDETTTTANTKVYNNTIVNNDNYGIEVEQHHNLDIKNNIIYGSTVAMSFESGSTTGHTIDYNLYTASSNFRWGSGDNINFATWKTNSSQDANSSEDDPLFNSNYYITNGSPAINNGDNQYSDGDGNQFDLGGFLVWDDDVDAVSGYWVDGVDMGAYAYIANVIISGSNKVSGGGTGTLLNGTGTITGQ